MSGLTITAQILGHSPLKEKVEIVTLQLHFEQGATWPAYTGAMLRYNWRMSIPSSGRGLDSGVQP